MGLHKTELAMLRKQYPPEHFVIREQGSKLEVVPRKCVIRLFKHQLKKLRDTDMINGKTVGGVLENRIRNTNLLPENFEQCQVTVEKKVADALAAEAKKCKTRKIIYLQKLLGGKQ